MVTTQNTSPGTRRYAFRRIVAAPEKKPAGQKLSYLYIGPGIRAAQEQHNGFEFSFFVYTYAEAFNLLKRLAKAGNLPSVILVDGVAEVSGISDIRAFFEKLRSQEQMKTLNVLVEVARCSEPIIAQLSREKGVADLVRIEDSETLCRKAGFFNTLETNKELLKTQVQAGVNWKLIARYGPVRAFDILFASICMLLLSPLFLLIAVLVKMDGGNSIFEYQIERGLRYRSFRYIRFRTDLGYVNKPVADFYDLNQLQLSGHSSKIGSILQRTNLDELPALFNIVMGDISFLRSR